MTDDLRNSVIRRLEFVRSELHDIGDLLPMDYRTYHEDRSTRRNLERIVENVVNASCDIGKIILTQFESPMPESYRGIFVRLAEVRFLNDSLSRSLIENTQLRNVLAHQYLDIKWEHIKYFTEHGIEPVRQFLRAVEEWLADRETGKHAG